MRRYLTLSIALVTLLLAWTTANGQTRFTERGSPAITDSYESGLNLYYKTWADLNDAQKHVDANPGDWYRFDQARGQMDVLERSWQDGSFDRSQIDQAINDLEFVLKFNSISIGHRDVLARDLDRLRDIRLRYAR